MLSYGASIIIITVFCFAATVQCGPLDWARADRIPIDVNLPWLPCKYIPTLYFLIHFFNNLLSK